MDRVEPELVDRAEQALRGVPGVHDVSGLRLRWIGHSLHAEAALVVDSELTLLAAHDIAAEAEHRLAHGVPRLTGATVHIDPATHPGVEHHHGVRLKAARPQGERATNGEQEVSRVRKPG
jgi:divalent metal cation (Fe/Co/Zn/Cd) transporter